MTAALILDCAGTSLSAEEKAFFRDLDPYGFILFARNCETPAQVKALVSEMKSCVGRDDVPVLIDQEGGRVARLRPPQWRPSPAAGTLAALGAAAAKRAIYLNARLIAHELAGMGINVDCAPVADLPVDGAHDIIGDRAYGRTANQVGELAAEMARGLMDGGVIPVVKHIPGHGRALADSHHDLPVVNTPLAELAETDFVPFKKLKNLPMAMTAHVVYTALDPNHMATISPTVIRYIRESIGFDGLLMSDDITMKAMSGTLAERTRAVLGAGCDVVLLCNASLPEQREVAGAVSVMSPLALARSERAFAAVRSAEQQFASMDAEAQLEALLREVA
jgi:beta-N-acetylhexosaminidase